MNGATIGNQEGGCWPFSSGVGTRCHYLPVLPKDPARNLAAAASHFASDRHPISTVCPCFTNASLTAYLYDAQQV